MTSRRAILGLLAGGAIIGVLGIAGLAFLLNTGAGRDMLRRLLVARLGDQVNGHITIGRLGGRLPNDMVLHDVALTDSAGSLVFGARRLAVKISLVQLLSKRIDVSHLMLERPTLVLRQRPGGEWNIAGIIARDDRPSSGSDGRGFGDWVHIADARITDGHVTVRVPRETDSAPAGATDGDRARIEHTPDGVERVMEFRQMSAQFPRVQLTNSDPARIVIEVARASTIAEPFRSPAADIRHLGGTLLVRNDSLHLSGLRVVLPGSRVTGEAYYAPRTGGLRGVLRADRVAFRDLHWLHPGLPAEGRGALTIDATREGHGPLELRATEIVAEVGRASARGALAMAIGDTLRLISADVRLANLATELARQLVPGLRVPLDGTLDARARLDAAHDGFRTDADLTFRDQRGGTSRVTGHGILTTGESLGARDLRIRLAPLQATLIRVLAPRASIRGAFTGRARVSGTARGGWEVSGDLSHIDRGARSRVIGAATVDPGARRLRFDGRFAPLSLDGVAAVVPDLGLHGSASGPVRADLVDDSVSFRTTLRLGEGTLGAVGGVSWRRDDAAYDVRLEPRGIDPHAVSTRAPRGTVTGTVTVRGRGIDARTARAEVSVALDQARVDRVTLDSLRLAAWTTDGVATIDSFAAWRRTASVAASGTVGLTANRRGELHYVAEADSLGDVFGVVDGDVTKGEAVTALPQRQVSGRGSLRGSAHGNVDALRITGRASFADVAAGARHVALACAEYALGVGRDDTVAVAATVDSARMGHLSYERGELTVAGTRSRLVADMRLRQDSVVDVAAAGVVSLAETSHIETSRNIALDLRELALQLPSGQWRSARPATVAWRHGGLVVDSLIVRGKDGASLEVTGTLPATGDGGMDVRVERLPLADVAALRQASDRMGGRVGVAARVTGTTAAPRGAGTADLTALVVQGDSLPPVRSSFSYADGLLTARGEVGAVATTPLARARLELPVNLALTGVSGSRLSRSGPLLVDIRADTLPLTALPRRRDVQIERGWMRGEVTVRGTVGEPAVAGHLVVRDGQAFIPATGVVARDIAVTARITNDSLVLDSVVARANGVVRASGALVRSPGAAGRVTARLVARDATVLGGSLGDMHADADLALSGTTDSLVVTGRAELLHGFLERKGPGEQALHVVATADPELLAIVDTSLIFRRPTAGPDVRLGRTLHTDLAVRIRPGVWYRSAPNAKVEVFTPRDVRVRGDLLAGDAAAGGVVLTRGGVYVFRLRPFAIVRGGATLAGASAVAPLIQATGEHEVWIVGRGMLPVRFLASGFPSDVRFSLGDASTLPAAPADVGTYLSLGRPPVSLLQTESSSLSGLSTSGGRFTGDLGALVRRQQVSPALGAVLYQLAKGARDAAGLRLFTVVPTDLPPELAESRFGGVSGTTMDGGYFIGSRTYLGARVRLSAVSPGFVLVHDFTPGLELRAAYEPLFRVGPLSSLGSPKQGVVRRAFGAFLTKQWWY